MNLFPCLLLWIAGMEMDWNGNMKTTFKFPFRRSSYGRHKVRYMHLASAMFT